jgi:hypothetical protein
LDNPKDAVRESDFQTIELTPFFTANKQAFTETYGRTLQFFSATCFVYCRLKKLEIVLSLSEI